jgi:hypothetical protein
MFVFICDPVNNMMRNMAKLIPSPSCFMSKNLSLSGSFKSSMLMSMACTQLSKTLETSTRKMVGSLQGGPPLVN